jgi:hypothetical protein
LREPSRALPEINRSLGAEVVMGVLQVQGRFRR